MSLFPGLSDNPHLGEVFQKFPKQVRPLLEYHDLLLRGDGPLSVAERELIATYVSGINACTFCFGAHKIYSRLFGISDEVIDSLMDDVDTSKVDEKMKPLLKYVGKLTKLPAQLVSADAEAVYQAGWNERALYDAVQICALFNFMNRIIEGTGITFDYAENPPSDEDIEARRTRSYMDFGRQLGIVD